MEIRDRDFKKESKAYPMILDDWIASESGGGIAL